MVGRFRHRRWVRRTTEESFARAFEALGHEVRRQEMAEGLEPARKAATLFRPDWTLLSKDFDMRPSFVERLREAGARRVAHWHFDSMYALGKLRWYRKVAGACDLALSKERGLFEKFRKWGLKPVYFDQGYDPEVIRPGIRRGSLAGQVGFIGTFYKRNERIALLRAVAREFRLRVWSQKPERYAAIGIDAQPAMFDEQVGDICASVDAVLGVNITHEIEGYWSNRQYLITGAGGFYICKYTPGLETVYENRRHVVWFETVDEAVDLLRRYLSDEVERRRIARAGHELARDRHTYLHRAGEIVRSLDSAV